MPFAWARARRKGEAEEVATEERKEEVVEEEVENVDEGKMSSNWDVVPLRARLNREFCSDASCACAVYPTEFAVEEEEEEDSVSTTATSAFFRCFMLA